MATITQNKTVQESCTCPYWSPLICCCLLVTDDFFIPLKDHIMMYCLSSRFSKCSYYSRQESIENQTHRDQKHSINNRRSTRTCRCMRFNYSEFIDNHFFKKRHDTTFTFDISDHGIRFASEKLFEPDTNIHFSVENKETFGTIEGVGKVVWCSPLKSSPFFQVGMAVTWLFR